MIQITPQMRICLAVAPVDFRRGIDGLARLCKERLEADPFSGILFVFTNRKRTALRILCFDTQGFWLCHKRLSAGRFRFWPDDPQSKISLDAHALQVLIMGGDPNATQTLAPWRRLAVGE